MDKLFALLERVPLGETEGLLSIIVYLTTAILVFVGLSWILAGRDPVSRRLKEIAEGRSIKKGEPQMEGTFTVKWIKPISDVVLPRDEWKKSRLRTKLVHAGYRTDASLHIFVTSKFFLALLLPILIILPLLVLGIIPTIERTTGVFSLLVAAVAGYLLPDLFLFQKKQERQLAFIEGFPDAMDMLVVCVEAGLGLDAAIQRVGNELHISHPELGDEFTLVSLELRAGKSREEALRALADRTGVEQVRALSAILIQSEHFGTSIASALREHAKEMRLIRIQTAKEKAAKLPVKLLFPLLFFIFPALFLVVLGPAAVRIFLFFLGPGGMGQ